MTAKGLYVCRRHGGSTPRQRGEVTSASAEFVRPPGRPATTGSGSRGPRRSVEALVQEYRDAQVDVDATDEHVLYLRAHLKESLAQRETEDDVEALLRALAERAQRLSEFLSAQKTVEGLTDVNVTVYKMTLFARLLFDAGSRFKRFVRVTREIERRHERLIRLTAVRARTRRANAAVHQVRDFAELLPKVLALLEPRLDEMTRSRLVARLRQEFSSIPVRALQPNTLAALPSPSDDRDGSRPETVIDALAEWLREQGTALDDPETDTLYLRAYLQNMASLFGWVTLAEKELSEVQQRLPVFLSAFGFGNDGRPMPVRQVLAEVRIERQLARLEKTLDEVVELLRRFGPELEERHARMIELALVRAQAREQDRAAGELTLQRHLVRRLHMVLLEVLQPADVEYVEVKVLTSRTHPGAAVPTPNVASCEVETEEPATIPSVVGE